MALLSKSVLRIISLFVGCLAIGTGYCINAFNIYANAIKQTFDYTQTQIGLIVALGYVGLLATLPGGLALEYFGAKKAALLGYTLSLAYFLQWSATLNPEFYHDNFWLFAIYCFLGGCGNGFMYLVSAGSNLLNFDQSKRGRVSGILQCCTSAGPGVFILLYNFCFTNGHVVDAVNQDLSGFFLMVAILALVVNTLAVIFYGDYREDSMLQETPDKEPEKVRGASTSSAASTLSIGSAISPPSGFIQSCDINDEDSDLKALGSIDLDPEKTPIVDPKEEELPLQTRDLTGIGLFKNVYFHCIYWPSIFLIAMEVVFVANITSMLSSFRMDEYAFVLSIINPIWGTVFKPVIGVLYDLVRTKIPGSAIIIFWAILDGLFYIFSIYFLYNIVLLGAAMIMNNMAIFVSVIISPLLLIDLFGKKYFPRNLAILTIGSGVITFILSTLFGVFYDLNLENEWEEGGETYCYGLICFTNYFILCAVLCFVAALVLIPLLREGPRKLFCRSFKTVEK